MGLLEGRVSIVTGGAGNLGAHISRLFAAQGAAVVINDVNTDRGGRVVDEINAAGGRGGGRARTDRGPAGRPVGQCGPARRLPRQ